MNKKGLIAVLLALLTALTPRFCLGGAEFGLHSRFAL